VLFGTTSRLLYPRRKNLVKEFITDPVKNILAILDYGAYEGEESLSKIVNQGLISG
jgi:hypothetical protein